MPDTLRICELETMTIFLLTIILAVAVLLIFVIAMSAKTIFTGKGPFANPHACRHKTGEKLKTTHVKKQIKDIK